MIRLISATTRTPVFVDPSWVSLVAVADTQPGIPPRARILVGETWIDVLEAPQLVANSLGKPARHVPVADISEVLRWAEAFFEQANGDAGLSEDEHDAREEGVAALDRVRTWLQWER